jgi:hypothetical protein
MVTQFHTLLHFVTLSTTDQSRSPTLSMSIRIMGVSKSHLLGIISDYAEHLRTYTHIDAYVTSHCSGACVLECFGCDQCYHYDHHSE